MLLYTLNAAVHCKCGINKDGQSKKKKIVKTYRNNYFI